MAANTELAAKKRLRLVKATSSFETRSLRIAPQRLTEKELSDFSPL
jgi:hypothetical protein